MPTLDQDGKTLNPRRIELAQRLGVPYEQVTDDQYELYRALRFAAAYGAGPSTFAKVFADQVARGTGRPREKPVGLLKK